MQPRFRLVWSPEFVNYDFGHWHPMSPVRLALTMSLAEQLGLLDSPEVEVADFAPADDELLALAHDIAYIEAVKASADDGVSRPELGLGTDDDPVFPAIHEASARVVAATSSVVRAVWEGEVEHGVNICGGLHHAMRDRAAGFCVYNDAAVAIAGLLAAGVERVGYVDLDAHHGDGVEAAFWNDPRVMTISLHESGETLFPGTGFPQDTGGPNALDSAINVALPQGTGGLGWLRAIDAVVLPALRQFRPQILISQHGADSHGRDPLAHLRVSVDAQVQAARLMHGLAHELCGGKWIALGGGGYDIVDVVPRAWAGLIAIATHQDLPDNTPVPEWWRESTETLTGLPAPVWMDDGEPGNDLSARVRPWSKGYDPADAVDRAIQATLHELAPLPVGDVPTSDAPSFGAPTA